MDLSCGCGDPSCRECELGMDFTCGCQFCSLRDINVTETSQGNSSDAENGASSSPSPGVYQVTSSTCTSSEVSVQASPTEIQARQLSLTQQSVSHAEQPLQQLQKQQLQLQQQQQNHYNHSNISNHHSHQNAFTQHYNSITHHHNQIPSTPNPASYPHDTKTAQPQILELSSEVTADVNELVQFAETFQQRRKEMGFTQEDVGRAMGKLYGYDSCYTISTFEGLKFSFQKMCELKPLLQKWLEDAESFHTNPGSLKYQMTTTEPIGRLRKKRTYIQPCVRVPLENAFLQNPKPTPEQIGMLAQSLDMEKKIVRLWFQNRRQKEKKINSPSTAMESSTITESAPSNMFASIATMGSPTITESAPSNMFASIAAMGSPTITETAPSDMFASIANTLDKN